jgi:hypothetical protein
MLFAEFHPLTTRMVFDPEIVCEYVTLETGAPAVSVTESKAIAASSGTGGIDAHKRTIERQTDSDRWK